MTKRRLVGLAALVAAACGGDRPTPPTIAPTPQPTPQALLVISGETGAPVVGARMIVNGEELTTDGAGRVTAAGGLAGTTLVDVLAEGFLGRQTLLSRAAGGAPYALWPRTSESGLDEHFTGEIVYTSANAGVANPTFAGESLRRWAPGHGPVEVVLQGPGTNPAFREFSAGAVAVQGEAVAAINDALGGRLVLQPPVFRDGVPAADRIVVRIFPEYGPCVEFGAGAFASLPSPVIREVTITFCTPRDASFLGLATHELGHAMGLGHSSSAADVMNPTRIQVLQPSARERLLLALMYQRLPGNRFPDNDRSAMASREATVEFSCR